MKNRIISRSLTSLITILMPLLFVVSGCKKEHKNNDTQPGTYYYKASIGGVQYSQSVTDANGYEAGSSVGGAEDVTISATINPKDYPYPAKSTAMDITKGLLHDFYNVTNEQFKAFFTPGDYKFTSGSHDGLVIDWFDENDVQWSTENGSGNQTGSTIKILSVKDAQSIINYYVEVKLQFSCKLYNDSGDMKEVKNGEFVGLFGKF